MIILVSTASPLGKAYAPEALPASARRLDDLWFRSRFYGSFSSIYAELSGLQIFGSVGPDGC